MLLCPHRGFCKNQFCRALQEDIWIYIWVVLSLYRLTLLKARITHTTWFYAWILTVTIQHGLGPEPLDHRPPDPSQIMDHLTSLTWPSSDNGPLDPFNWPPPLYHEPSDPDPTCLNLGPPDPRPNPATPWTTWTSWTEWQTPVKTLPSFVPRKLSTCSSLFL